MDGNVSGGTLKGELNVAFKIPFVFDFIRKQCMQQAEVTRNARTEMSGTLDTAEISTGQTKGVLPGHLPTSEDQWL
jgi:hypothetical protein